MYCNYTCSHCYSSSSPATKGSLDVGLVLQAMSDAVDLGYTTLSVSGGEPMLYPDLQEILLEAKALGMSTSVITNGSFPESAYAKLEGLVDVIGVSLDGNKDLHNRIRQNITAFDKVDRFLDFSSKYFSATGIAYSLSDPSWEDLPEMLDYADSKKVTLFQVQPIESFGRARDKGCVALASANLKRAFIFVNTVRCEYPFSIQMNVFDKASAIQTLVRTDTTEPAADCIDLLVMDEKGRILPYNYGFDERWMVADLRKISLKEGWERFRLDKLPAFGSWCKDSVDFTSGMIFTPSEPFFNRSQKKLSLVED
ncbi:MAG: radical SAM protein [Reichenbachiella sp.]|uniref:radical SAM protein n=1 Tax=Reichenbachiella sp. TaxID=2184521 RepID=UPI0032656CA6